MKRISGGLTFSIIADDLIVPISVAREKINRSVFEPNARIRPIAVISKTISHHDAFHSDAMLRLFGIGVYHLDARCDGKSRVKASRSHSAFFGPDY